MDEPRVLQSTRLTAATALTGLLAYVLAIPPFNLWPCILIVPVAWLYATLHPAPVSRRGYTLYWLSGVSFWLWVMQGTRLSHPALYPGWITLALYLGVYFPLFVGLTRVAIWQLRIPVIIASPIIMMGLELIRAYAFTGLSVAMLGHALIPSNTLFQIADLAGSYTASGLVVATAVPLAFLLLRFTKVAALATKENHVRFQPLYQSLLGLVLCAMAWGYGLWKQGQIAPNSKPLLRIALLQADAPAIFEANLERDVAAFYRYLDLSRQAGAKAKGSEGVDLVVWPESMFGAGKARYAMSEEGIRVPQGMQITTEEFRRLLESEIAEFDARAGFVQAEIERIGELDQSPWLIVGASQVEYNLGPEKIYSVAFLYNPERRLADWYGKRHLVMFGEYIPFGSWFPWLYQVLPLSYGVTPGPRLLTQEVNGVHVAPSICFETMVEPVANHQFRELRRRGTSPQLLINITNDGWFHGSTILDHHLRCTQAIAATHHVPVVIAANSGITAWIDGSGQVVESLPRQTEGILFAEPRPDGRFSLYAIVGDWPVCLCALLTTYIAWRGWRNRRAGTNALAAP